jgi:hypothetical protein
VIRANRFDRLWPDYRLRYVVAKGDAAATLRSQAAARMIWSGGDVAIFDLGRP